MVYAIVGIPLCLSVLADIGQILATIINKMVEQYKTVVVPILYKYNILAQKKKLVNMISTYIITLITKPKWRNQRFWNHELFANFV